MDLPHYAVRAFVEEMYRIEAEEKLNMLLMFRAAQAELKDFRRVAEDLRRTIEGDRPGQQGERSPRLLAAKLRREVAGKRGLDGMVTESETPGSLRQKLAERKRKAGNAGL